jgi:hypothetical protein
MTFKPLPGLLKQPPAYQWWMGITNDNPVFFLVGH